MIFVLQFNFYNKLPTFRATRRHAITHECGHLKFLSYFNFLKKTFHDPFCVIVILYVTEVTLSIFDHYVRYKVVIFQNLRKQNRISQRVCISIHSNNVCLYQRLKRLLVNECDISSCESLTSSHQRHAHKTSQLVLLWVSWITWVGSNV